MNLREEMLKAEDDTFKLHDTMVFRDGFSSACAVLLPLLNKARPIVLEHLYSGNADTSDAELYHLIVECTASWMEANAK